MMIYRKETKSMKKRTLALLALAGLLVFTAACGGKKDSEKTSEKPAAEEEDIQNSKITKLGTYKGVEVPAASTEVTDEEVQAEIDRLLAAHQEAVPVEGKTVVEEGDTVNIDYVGKRNGEEFQGGNSNGAGYNLTIGSHSFIDGFEDGLIGKEVGGTYDLNLTFPEQYPNNPDLAGQAVVFTVEVHNIVKMQNPEWNDDFVKANTEYGTVDAYMEGTRASLKKAKEKNAQDEKEYNVIQAIIDHSEFDCAEEDVASLKDQMKQEYQSYAAGAGMEFADFLMYYMGGMTEEQFDVQVQNLAEFQLKSRLAVEAISEAENLKLTEEEYQKGLASLAADNGYEDGAAMEKEYGRTKIEKSLTYDKTIDFVVGKAVEKEQ